MMTWTPDSTHDCRDLSFIIGQDFETNSFSDCNSIETRRDMSVEMPAVCEVNHGDDLDTRLDSRLAGYELHTPPHEIAESTIDHGDD